MRIAVTGSNGLLGTALVAKLTAERHSVARLVRRETPPDSPDIYWDSEKGAIDAAKLEGMDAVVHLAGETVAERWTAKKKEAIRWSRVQGTGLIADTLRKLSRRPQVLVSASGIGYYGDCGAEVLREESAAGKDFLAQVCREWEAATEPASRAGIRVVHLRIGVVLSVKGGALAKMLTPFRMGAGGKIGSGKQYMSWIDIDDMIGIFLHAIQDASLQGAVNAVAPSPVTNLEFTKALGVALSRPTIAPLPGFMVKLLFGEMGESLLLGSQRVEPSRLAASGFKFQYPTLEESLRHVLAA